MFYFIELFFFFLIAFKLIYHVLFMMCNTGFIFNMDFLLLFFIAFVATYVVVVVFLLNLFPQYYTAFHFLLNLSVCNGQCPNPDTFEFIPEDDYDRDFSSVTPGERPLGFEFTILYYEADGQPNPCYEIPDTNDRRVEIMAEPDGGGSSQLW